MLIKILIASIISSILYRMGGAKGYNTKFRDWGCSIILILLSGLLFVWGAWWLYLLTFLLSWGALSTYWDSVFGYDNFFVHGLGCGLAGIPLIWCGVAWWIILIRIIVCTLGMGLWSKWISNDVREELIRGFLFII